MAYTSNYSTTYIQAYPPNYAQPSGDNFAVDAGKGILESSPYAKSLAELVNQTNLAANRNRLGTTGAATEDQLSQNIYRRSQGLLDPATEQMMQSRIAAMGGNRGMGVDSANLASAYYGALGETIQAQEEQALKDYATLQATTPTPVGMEQFLMTPGQYGSLQNERYKTNMNYLNNLLGLQNQVGMGGGYGYGRGRGSAAPGFHMWPQSTAGANIRTPPAQDYTGYYNEADLFGTPAGYGEMTYGQTPSSPSGSSVFGSTNYGDIFDPSGLASPFGSMPDYSYTGTDPMAGLPIDAGYEDWLSNFGE